jgi:hypothetical protein
MDDSPEHASGPKPRRKRHRPRVGLIGLALLGLGLLAAACGGGGTGPGVAKSPSTSSTTASSSSKSAAYQSALAFTVCMRSHGEPNFPDPNASGGFNNITGNPNDPQMHAAQQACSSLLPNGGNQTSGGNSTPSQLTQLLNYAKCMRSHGVLNFPDPTSKGLGSLNGIDMNSPQFNTASQACQSLLPSSGGSGPVTRPGGGS